MFDRYDPRSSDDRDRDDFGDRSRGSGGGGSFARGLLAASSGDGTTGGGTSSARGGSVGGVELCTGDDAGRAELSRLVTGSPTWITTVSSASVRWSSCSCQRRSQYRAGVPVKVWMPLRVQFKLPS